MILIGFQEMTGGFFSGLKLHNILHFRFSMVKLKGRTEASINVLLDLL